MELEQYDVIEAIFTPRRTDDLRPSSQQVGVRQRWDVMWPIEDGDYAGEFACVENGFSTEFRGWIPSGDLSDIRVVSRVFASANDRVARREA